MLRVGIDVGGTFTDLFAWDENDKSNRKVLMSKVLTTPKNPVNGFMNALSEAGIPLEEIDTIIHGTTIGTNALIERKYPEPAVITTEGFRDTIEIKRQSRKHLYDPYAVKPTPLVSRNNRFTVSEKLGVNGETVKDLNRKQAYDVANKIKSLGIKNIAVTFINSYVDGRHEKEMREILQEVIPDASIALSSETSPKIRELGRFTTTVIRACLYPVVGQYIENLENTIREKGCKAPLFIVKSNGGMMKSDTAKERPEEMIESGPAGGVAAGSYLRKLTGINNMILTDVGGTSFEACLMENGKGLITDEYELEWEMPIITPMLDIRSIGAGGGSIAWVDAGNSLRVGPQSAGADPGPACYGKGGLKPTVTDANFVLGRLNPTLSGKLTLDLDAAIKAIETLAKPLGLTVMECAEGIVKIACESMADAIRMVSTDRGRDPRDQTYVSYGGAGGLHAYLVAESAGINNILIPSFVGVDCAVGGTIMDVKHDVEGTFYSELETTDANALTSEFEKLEKNCISMLKNDGIDERDIILERNAMMRYIGQSYEVATPVPDGQLTKADIKSLSGAFHKVHKQEYGVYNENFGVACVTLRVTGYSESERDLKNKLEMGQSSGESNSVRDQRDVYFDGEKHLINVHNINIINQGETINGPAIIEHPNSEIVIPPNANATLDKYGFIHMKLLKSSNVIERELML